jgi:hypothetical protein
MSRVLVLSPSRTRLTPALMSVLLVGCAICTVLPAHAISDAQFHPAFQSFSKAAEGDTSAIATAATAFEALRKPEASNPVLLAYSGAATSMRANTTWMPWKKMSFAEDGLAQLDRALGLLKASHDAPLQQGVPAVLDVKFVAASTFLAVPGFMNRHERGSRLLAEVLNHPLLASSPLPFRGAVWLAAARQAQANKQNADVNRYVELIVQQHAPQAEQAQQLLTVGK